MTRADGKGGELLRLSLALLAESVLLFWLTSPDQPRSLPLYLSPVHAARCLLVLFGILLVLDFLGTLVRICQGPHFVVWIALFLSHGALAWLPIAVLCCVAGLAPWRFMLTYLACAALSFSVYLFAALASAFGILGLQPLISGFVKAVRFTTLTLHQRDQARAYRVVLNTGATTESVLGVFERSFLVVHRRTPGRSLLHVLAGPIRAAEFILRAAIAIGTYDHIRGGGYEQEKAMETARMVVVRTARSYMPVARPLVFAAGPLFGLLRFSMHTLPLAIVEVLLSPLRLVMA